MGWWLVPVIVIVGAIAVVELISWNFLKPLITDRIQQATGRPAVVHGDVSVGLFPKLQLAVHQVELGNPQWAATPNMLEAQRISVSPSFTHLIRGEVVLDDIELAGLILNLEQRADAPANWVFTERQGDQQASADETTGSPIEVRSLSVSDTNIHFRGAEAETPLTFTILTLELQSDNEALETQGAVMFQEQRFELEFKSDPVEAFLNDDEVFDADFSISAGESLTIDARLERQGTAWRVYEIETALAESQLSGELTVDTAGDVPNLGGQLHSARLDVAALQAGQEESGGDSGFSVPVLPDLHGEIALTVDHLILEQAELQSIQAQVQFGEHSVALSPLSLRVYDANLEAEANLSSSPERVSAMALIDVQNLDLTKLNDALPAGDPLKATISLELGPVEKNGASLERFPFKAEGTSDGVSIQISSTLAAILDLQSLDGDVVIEADSAEALERWIGPVLPPLPGFRVAGHLTRDQQNWTATGLEGVVGDSDLNGHLTISTGATPPRVSGELSSGHLNIADLGFLAGATPEETRVDDGRVLPDTPIITEAWHRVSADLSYRGESVRAGDVPLSNVVIDLVLEDGRGRFDPVGFGIGQGTVDLILDMNAGTSPPSGTVQVEVQGVDLNDALQNWELADESVGIIGGHGKLWVEGASIGELLASADGGVVLVMSGGKLDALLVEVAGIDAGQTILSWLRGRDPVPIDCAYADLQVRGGITELDTFVVDTSDTTFTAGGQVDLNTESLDISLIAHPKDLSVFVGRSPLHLGGTFDDVKIAVHREELAVRVGASLGLAALAGPLAAIVPLIDVGTGTEVDYCQGLIIRTQKAVEEEGDQ